MDIIRSRNVPQRAEAPPVTPVSHQARFIVRESCSWNSSKFQQILTCDAAFEFLEFHSSRWEDQKSLKPETCWKFTSKKPVTTNRETMKHETRPCFLGLVPALLPVSCPCFLPMFQATRALLLPMHWQLLPSPRFRCCCCKYPESAYTKYRKKG